MPHATPELAGTFASLNEGAAFGQKRIWRSTKIFKTKSHAAGVENAEEIGFVL
jgi:hypothetical protein